MTTQDTSRAATAEIPAERLLSMYRTIVRVRTFDDKLTELGRKREPIVHHPTRGQEAPSVAGCAALRPGDVIMPYHRGWGWAIGKGMEPGRILAELLGKRTGYGGGKSGPNLADWDLGVLGRPGTQGAHLQIAAGVGLALRLEGRQRVCLAFFGEGASNTGAFHEGLNLAAIWNASTIYICESNGYQSDTPASKIMRTRVVDRASGYGIPGVAVDGNDAVQIYQAVRTAIERARSGDGPTLIDCETYRMGVNFYVPDGIASEWRPASELEAWAQKDPIRRLRAYLVEHGLLDEAAAERIERDAEAEVAGAVQFAYSSDYSTREELSSDVYAP